MLYDKLTNDKYKTLGADFNFLAFLLEISIMYRVI